MPRSAGTWRTCGTRREGHPWSVTEALKSGWLEVDRRHAAATLLTGHSMSLSMRACFGGGDEGALVTRRDDGDSPSYGLYVEDGSLSFLLGVTAPDRTGSGEQPDGSFELSVPLEMIGETGWRDIIVRCGGAGLELFVDGVLVDEEWPLGELRQSAASCLIGASDGAPPGGFGGLIDHLALWRRALTDGEVRELSGGAQVVETRELEILGPERPIRQYWRPRGHNTGAGDCMCTWDGNRFHLFWLFDRRQHRSKWGLGAHQYAHASTEDLVSWQHHEMAVPITEQWEGSMCTGNVLYHEGRYHACYYVRPTGITGHHPGGFAMATSEDGLRFDKSMDPDPSLGGGDPLVFHDEDSALFHLLMPGPDTGGGKSRTRFISRDLKTWEIQPEPFIVPEKESTSLECPDLFHWNDWWYFIMGRDGLWRSKSPLGPWEAIQEWIYDGAVVQKVAAFGDNRVIMAGWLSDSGWSGNLVFRELVQLDEGLLGVRFLPEMMPALGAAVATSDSVRLEPGAGAEMAPALPNAAAISMEIRFSSDSRLELAFGRGFSILCGSQGLVRFVCTGTSTQADGFTELVDVDGLDVGPFTLQIIIAADIVDLCIDGRRCMVGRFHGLEPESLQVRSLAGEVTLTSIEAHQLEMED